MVFLYIQVGAQFKFDYETLCDVECITHLFATRGIEFCVQNLDGVFAFVLVDSNLQRVYVGRDPYGVRPLFRLTSDSGVVGFCSEAKGTYKIKIKKHFTTFRTICNYWNQSTE